MIIMKICVTPAFTVVSSSCSNCLFSLTGFTFKTTTRKSVLLLKTSDFTAHFCEGERGQAWSGFNILIILIHIYGHLRKVLTILTDLILPLLPHMDHVFLSPSGYDGTSTWLVVCAPPERVTGARCPCPCLCLHCTVLSVGYRKKFQESDRSLRK